MDIPTTCRIVAQTLRQAAFWGIGDKNQQTLLTVADDVERADAESLAVICPVCEETLCDGDCPLAEVRKPLVG